MVGNTFLLIIWNTVDIGIRSYDMAMKIGMRKSKIKACREYQMTLQTTFFHGSTSVKKISFI